MEKTKRRMTKQRKRILEVLKSTKIHPTADWVYEKVREDIPNVSLGTIYRNLNVLKDMGEIIELNYASDQSRFDGNVEKHYHFSCQNCDRVLDLEIELDNDGLENRVEEAINGQVKKHRFEFFGLCNECS